MTSALLTLTKGQGYTTRLKVTDVGAFSECFLSSLLLRYFSKEQKWPQEDVSNVRNKGSNYPLISHRGRNTETDIKQSLPYGTAPGIEC